MFEIIQQAFEHENSAEVRKTLLIDDEIDNINADSEKAIAEWIKQHPEDVMNALIMLEIIKRLERFGDQLKNISHEIIFHLEAKVLKHHKKLLKQEKENFKNKFS